MVMRDTEFERQYAEATLRGEHRLQHEPRAVAARYDRRTRKLVIELNNGCTLLVPPDLAEGLSTASPADLAGMRILGPGTAIAWPRLDVQFSVTGLLAGIFGTQAWMAELGRAPGRAKTAAKPSAARRNGAKSGRPRKTTGKR